MEITSTQGTGGNLLGSEGMASNGSFRGGGVIPPIPAVWKVIGRSDISFNDAAAATGREAVETRLFMKVLADCTSLRFYGSNNFITAAGVETASANSEDFSVALENSAATLTIVAPQGAVTLPGGAGLTLIGEIQSSAFSLAKFTKGDVYYARERMVCAAAARQLQFPGIGTPNSSGEMTFRGAIAQTQIANTGPLSGTGLFALGSAILPFLTVGLSTTHGRAWGCVGTSIPWGQGDAGGLNYGDGGPSGSDGRTLIGGGYVRRATYALALPLAMLARQATTALSYTTSSTVRKQVYPFIDRLFVEFSTNDFAAGSTSTQVKGYLETIIADAKAINPNILCYVQTCLPRGATNGYVTPFAGEADRLAFNTLVRAGNIIGATDFFDAAVVVESTTVVGTWADNLDNVDGTHLSSQGHGKLSTALQAKLPGWG